MAIRTRCLLPLLVVACLAAPAQTVAPLGVHDAIALAARQNLDLLAVRRRRAEALAGVQIARQRPNPSLAFEAARDAPHQSVLFTQPLELGGKRQGRIRLAEQEALLTDIEIEQAGRQLRRSVREAYYTLAETRAESERLARVLAVAERLRTIADQRYQAGDVARLEVIQAELEVSRARADIEVGRQREKVAASELNALVNEPSAHDWQLAGSLLDPIPALALPNLLTSGFASNPELKRLDQEAKIEEARVALLKAERVPNLEASAGSDFNAPGDFRAGPRVGLGLEMPLFSRNQGQISQTLARRETISAEIAATRRSIAGRVEAALLELDVQRTQVELYRDRVLPAARELESLSEESYRAGRAGILVVLGAQRNVQDVERAYVESLLALQSAFARLEEAVGAPLD